MTLNEWEQSNIEVLTSREMGEWLCRRENRLLDKIRAEIKGLTYYWCEVNPRTVIDEVLDIIDKYRKEQEDADSY